MKKIVLPPQWYDNFACTAVYLCAMKNALPPSGSMLFIDKVFLQQMQEPLRGVEHFNLNLLHDLVGLGCSLTIAAEISWRNALQPLEAKGATVLYIQGKEKKGFAILGALRLLTGRRFDHFLLGNVGNSLIPLILWLTLTRAFQKAVLIAHREADAWFIGAWKCTGGTVVTVNGQIATAFTAAGCTDVHVDYGITRADRFFPADTPPAAEPVRFIVLGDLDSAWKGADTALEALSQLAPAYRGRAELHLVAYRRPPSATIEGVLAYPWLPLSDIPGLLRTMHVMICPSRDEGKMMETFSQAMVQGMLSGLPVLANDLPVLTEKLDAGGGLVFTSASVLSAHMTRMIDDPALRDRLGAEARHTALARYVWDTARFLERYVAAS